MTLYVQELLAELVSVFEPSEDALHLAQRSLEDTIAVAFAARNHPIRRLIAGESDVVRLAALGHVLDYDDLHLPSTTHLSVVCMAAALASGGSARSYLAGAVTMARIGTALGWLHYSAGWHTTCTAGAPAAAVAASVAMGLSAPKIAHAIGLSLSAAGGVQGAFGTDSKSIQVALAADAGVRAARLAERGARSSPGLLEQWLDLHRAQDLRLVTESPELSTQLITNGLALKIFPCCYALQRPIVAASLLRQEGVCADDVISITVRAPEATIKPLIHHRPGTGLEGKFSLEYGIAAALIDECVGFASFEDKSVGRAEARRLVELVTFDPAGSGESLLAGDCGVEIVLRDGSRRNASVAVPPGAPGGEFFPEFFRRKLSDCGFGGQVDSPLTWDLARELAFDEMFRQRHV